MVPRMAKNASGSNSLPASGVTAAMTAGSARGAKALATIPHTESLVLGSVAMIASSARSQPSDAPGCELKMVTASFEAPAAWLQRNKSAAGRPSNAAACSRQRVAETACARQKLAFSTPEWRASATSVSARAIAVWAASQPRVSDQRSNGRSGGRPAIPWGAKIITGPRSARARSVTERLSARVEVVTTAPGASRIMGMTSCRPLPDRGGPKRRIESSTLAQQSTPLEEPSR